MISMEAKAIIPIVERDGQQSVSARDLHAFLGVDTPYKLWHKRMFEYGFEENVDYVAMEQKSTTAQGNSYTFIVHMLTLDTAKEIAMLQRSEKGKQARRYFIEVEKQAKEMYRQLQVAQANSLSPSDIKAMIQTEIQLQMGFNLAKAIQDAVQSVLLPAKAQPTLFEKPKGEPTIQSAFEVDVKRSLSRIQSKVAMIESVMDANLMGYQQMYLPYYQNITTHDKAIAYAHAAAALNIIVTLIREGSGYGELFFEDAISVLKRRYIHKLPYTVRHLRNKVLQVIREGELITDVVTPARIGNQNARKYDI
jgi:phage anti-repressor protein